MELNKLLQQRIGWTPHPAQVEILEGKKRFTVICAGTRFGKSQLCAYLALKKFLNKGTHTWIVSPTYDLSKKVFDHLVTFLSSGFPDDLKRGKVKVSHVAGKLAIRNPRTRSWVECKSAEAETQLLGEELDLVIMDECSRMARRIWDSYVYQRLISREGEALFISTPFGKNWFHNLWVKFKNKDNGAAFHFTTYDNPYVNPEELEEQKQNLPEAVFKQEVMATFLDDAATVFRGIDDIVWGKMEEAKPGHFYVMGVDLGKYKDFTVITVIDRTNHKMVYFDRFKDIDWNLQKARISEVAKKYKALLIIDSTGLGDPIVDDLQRDGISINDFKYTNKSKQQLIQKLSIFIEQKRFNILPIDVLVDELKSFGYRMTKTGKIQYSAPEGLHDDCVNSLALAVWELNEKPSSSQDNQPIIIKW